MTSKLIQVTVDASDACALATFWATALGWVVEDNLDQTFDVLPTDGTQFGLCFLPLPSQKSSKNQLHLDLTTSSEADQRELIKLLFEHGAQYADVGQTGNEGHVVLADPEGNEFCVIEPENSFLAGCGRLGSVTCDGSPEVGHFWSEVLGWPLVWDENEETAIRDPSLTGPFITWGPPQPNSAIKNRLHLDVAPPLHEDQHAEVERLRSLGASLADIGQGDVSWVVMRDPDGNEFCVLAPR